MIVMQVASRKYVDFCRF